MIERARIAVIGTGWWSTYTHIPGLLDNPNAELVAICDSNPEKLDAAAASYQVARTYTDVKTLLQNESLDGAVVATYHASHYENVRDCLAVGLHVMVEKPMTLYARDAKALVDLAQQQTRELIVGYPYNYTPHALRVREILSSGVLGAIQFVTSTFNSNVSELFRGNDGAEGVAAGQSASLFPVHGPGDVYAKSELSGGGHGHLQMTHPLGLLFFVSGLRMKNVHARMSNHGLPVDLVDAMTVEFENGALGAIGGTGNIGGGRSIFDMLFYCERGNVRMDMNAQTVTIRGQDIADEDLGPDLDEPARYRRFETANNLVDVVLGKQRNGSPGEVGWRVVELLDGAYRSARKNGDGIALMELYEE